MISCYLNSFILNILFLTIIKGHNSFKILQINEPTLNLCSNETCIIAHHNDFLNLLQFTTNEDPDILLWFGKFRTNRTIFEVFKKSLVEKKPKVIVLPVFGSDTSQSPYYNVSQNDGVCNHTYSMDIRNVSIVILNPTLWLNQSNSQIECLKKILIRQQLNKKKAIVIAYDVPGFLEDSPVFRKYAQSNNEMLVELLENYTSSVIEGIFGSEHIDSFRIVRDKQEKPVLPLFISPRKSKNAPSSIERARTYLLDNSTLAIVNYIQWQGTSDSRDHKWSKMYDHNTLYGPNSTSVEALFVMWQSLMRNDTNMTQRYLVQQVGNLSLFSHCPLRCCVACYILNLRRVGLDSCLRRCGSVDSITRPSKPDNSNNNAFYVLGVIVGFVAILVGIVLAVNKVYCSRQRSVFLTTMTLDVPIDIIDDSSDDRLDGKLSLDITVEDKPKSPNGHRVPPHENYDYIRM